MKARIKGYERVETVLPHAAVVDFIWHPGDITPMHDHRSGDGSPLRGFVLVRKGTLFQVTNDGVVTHHEAGSHFIEVPDGFVHAVGNDGPEDAESTHMYFPSLRMQEFPYPPKVRQALAAIGIEV